MLSHASLIALVISLMSVALLLTGIGLFTRTRYHRGRRLQREATLAKQRLEMIAVYEKRMNRTKLTAYETKRHRLRAAQSLEGHRSRYILDVDLEVLETFRQTLLASGYRVQLPRGFNRPDSSGAPLCYFTEHTARHEFIGPVSKISELMTPDDSPKSSRHSSSFEWSVDISQAFIDPEDIGNKSPSM